MTTVKIECVITEEGNQLHQTYISGTCGEKLRALWSERLQKEPFKDFDDNYNKLVKEYNEKLDLLNNLYSQKKFLAFKKNKEIKKQIQEIQEQVDSCNKKLHTEDYNQDLIKQKAFEQLMSFLKEHKAALIYQMYGKQNWVREIWAVEDF